MSVSVDEKIVQMKFDNKQFEKGCAESIKTIDKLNKSANLKEASKGFQEFEKAANGVNFSRLEQNVAGLSKRFSAMGIAGMTVIQDITHGAINMGKKLAGILSAPINQIKSGGISRALNLEQARFQIEGLNADWNTLLEDINYGVQDTAYGLDAAAKAASMLTASGIEAGDKMKASLRGISGVAAMTGSSYEDIANIFTTVAGNGRLMSMQLLQLSSKGINAAATLGKQLGKTEAEVREMVTKGQIDFATFSKAMDDAFGQHAKDANKTFEGSISNVKAALSKIGALFAAPIIENAIGPINAFREGLNAFKAVLEGPKGLSTRFTKLTERVSEFITAIMTDERFTKSITAATEGLVGVISFLGKIFKPIASAFQQIFPPASLDAILTAATRFKEFATNLTLSGERADQLRSIARGVLSVFKIFLNVAGLIKDILFDIARSKVGSFFLKLAASVGDVLTVFGQFVYGLRYLYKSASETFGGIGGVFANIGEVGKAFGDLVANTLGRIIPIFKIFGRTAEEGVGKAGESFSRVGSIFKAVGDAIKSVAIGFWNLLKKVFEPVKRKISELIGEIPDNLKTMIDSMTNIFKRGDKAAQNSVMFKVLQGITTAIKVVIAILVKLGEVVRDVFTTIAKNIGTAGLGNLIEQALSIGILATVKRFITKFMQIGIDLKGLTGTFKGLLTEVKYSLISFQRSMQTKRILEIAIAIGLLSGALLLLSTINPKGITTGLAGLAGVTFLMVAAFGAMKAIEGKDGKGLSKIGFQLIEFSIAITIMASALKKIADLDIKQVAIGLAGLGGSMVIMVAAVKVLGSGGQKIMKGALQLILLAQAVKMLAGVMKDLSTMQWDELGRGLAGLGGVLLELLIFSKIMNKTKIKMTTATAIVILSKVIQQLVKPIGELGHMDWHVLKTGLASLGIILLEIAAFSVIISKLGNKMGMFKATGIYIIVNAICNIVEAVKELGGLDIDTLKKGLASIGVIMLELSVFSAIMSRSKGMLIKSVAISILVKALQSINEVVKSLGSNDIVTLAKGLGAMAVALAAITGALALTSKGSVLSAAAFAVVAGAINTMAASIKLIGSMDFEGVVIGLGAIVIAIGALTAAVKLMKGSIRGAAAMLVVANALMVLAPALAIMGNMPMDSMITAIIGLAGALTIFVVAGKAANTCVPGILALSGGLAILGVAFIAFGAGVLLFGMGVNTLVDAVVKIANLGNQLVESAKAVGAGVATFIISLIKGLAEGAWEVGKAGAELVMNLVKAIAEKVPDLVDMAFKMILAFINGLADGVKKYLPKIMDAIGNLMGAIVEGLAEWFDQFTELGIGGMAKIVGAVLLVIGLFKLLSESVSKLKPGNVGGAIAMILGIVAIVTSLMLLANIPWTNLLSAATALTAVLLAFSGAMVAISKVKFNVAQVSTFLLGALSLIEIGAALLIVSTQPWKSILAAGIAMTTVFAAYTAAFMAISKMNFTPATIVNITMFGLGTLALLPVAASLKLLANENWSSLLSAAASIVAVILGYSAVFAIMGALPIGMALAAIANLAIAITGIAAIIALMGALNQIPGFSWLIGEGGELLVKIGDILGGFIGSIIAGVGKAISSMLPALGADLGAFMVNATPFFVGMKMVDSSTVDSTLSLATAILALSGAGLLDGIASLLGADFSDLGTKLSEFAYGVVDFAEITKDLDGEKVQAAAAAAALLGELAGDIPLEGGLLGAIMGDHITLDEFGNRLPALAEGIVGFADKTKDLDPKAVEAAANAASLLVKLAADVPLEGGLLGAIIGDHIKLDEFGNRLPALGEGLVGFADATKDLNPVAVSGAATAAGMLVQLASDMPLEGGILGAIIGEHIKLDEFGSTLPELGRGLKGFADSVSGMSTSDVMKGSTAAAMMVELSKGMPTTGGIIGFLTGEADTLDEFGERLPVLGQGLKDFAANVAGIDMNAATNATVVAQMLAALANTVPDSGGIASWFEGDNTLDDFGEQLPPFGEYIKEFSDKITGMDVGAVSVAATGISGVVKMMEIATNNNVKPADIKSFGENIRQLGEDYRQFATDTVAASTEGPKKFKEGIDTIVSSIKKLDKVDTTKVKSFFNNTKGLTNVGVQDITKSANDSVDGALKALKSKNSEFQKVGKELMDYLKAGISNSKDSIKKAVTTIATTANGAIRDFRSKFRQSGEYLADGFINGISDGDHISASNRAGAALAKAALEGFRQEADIHSPSKKAEKDGENLTKGAVKGMKKHKDKAKDAGEELATQGLNGLTSKQSLFGNAGSDAAGSYIDSFRSRMESSNIFSQYANTNLGLDDAEESITGKKHKKKKKKPEKNKTPDISSQLANTASSTSSGGSSGGGGGGGGSTKEEPKWTEKDAKKALENYKLIVGSFVKNSKKLEKEFTKIKSSKVYKQFKHEFNDMSKGLGKSLSHISSAVVAYAKNSKKAIEYAKGTVKAFKKIYGKGGNKAVGDYAQRLYEASDQYKQDVKNAKKLNKQHNKNIKEAKELKKKIKETDNKEQKKKYAEELEQLRKDDKALLKELNKQVTAIAKGPMKALKAAKKSLIQSYKSIVDISNWDISPRFDLSGFDAMKDVTAQFSIFGDVASESYEAFNMFGVSLERTMDDVLGEASETIQEITENFDMFNASMDTGIDLFNRFTKTGTYSKDALFEDADSQLEAYEEFYDGIENLRKKGFDDQMIEQLESQGPQALNYVRGFLNMSDAEVESYNKRISKKYDWEAKTLERNMQRQLSQYEKFNKQIEELASRGLSEGIINKLKESGVSQAAYVQAMTHMDGSMLSNISDIYKKSVTVTTKTAEEQASTSGTQAGKTYTVSYLQAIKDEMADDETWKNNIEKLKEMNVRQEIIDQFIYMGKAQAGAYVDSILKESAEGINELNKLYDQYIVTTTKTFLQAATEQKEARDKYNQTMADFRRVAAANGLNPEVIRAIEGMAEEDAQVYAKSIMANVADIPKINELYMQSGASAMDNMTNSIVSQYEAADEYNADLAKALQNIGSDEKGIYTKYLKDMGLEGAEYVKALANATTEQIAKFRQAIDEREKRNMEERARATMEAYQKQIDGVKNYEKNLQELVKRGASRELVDSIAKMAESDPLGASEKIEDLLTLAPEKFTELNQQYTETMSKDIKGVVDKIFADYSAVGTEIQTQNQQLGTQATQGGNTAITNLVEGLRNMGIISSPDAENTGLNIGNVLMNGLFGIIQAKVAENKPVDDLSNDMVTQANNAANVAKIFSIGTTMIGHLTGGISKEEPSLSKKSKEVATQAHDKFANKLSKANGNEIAKKFAGGGIKGYFTANSQSVAAAAKDLADKVYNKVANTLSKSNGAYIGRMFVEGLIDGLADEKRQLELEKEARRLAALVEDEINARAKIESPSKVTMWSGRMMVEGLAKGLADNDKVAQASESLAETAMGSLQTAISQINEGVGTELDFNPVITPTLNLSKVTMQARQLNSIIDGQRLNANVKANVETDAQNQNGQTIYNFEQNNYSPKALSREEIYRQTRNQLAMTRKAVYGNDQVGYGY